MAKQTLIVSERGQITLPKNLRTRLSIKPGSALIAEEKDGQLLLRRAAVTPVHVYSDEEIEGWLAKDQVSAAERKRIMRKASRS